MDFDHVSLNGTMVLTMVVHGRPWWFIVDRGEFRQGPDFTSFTHVIIKDINFIITQAYIMTLYQNCNEVESGMLSYLSISSYRNE